MRHQRPALIFDGDDTLWDTMPLYIKAKKSFLRLMKAQRLDQGVAERTFEACDRRNVRNLGFSKKRFGLSMIQTYRLLRARSGFAPSKSVERRIRTISDFVFRSDPLPIPDVIPTLDVLRKPCRLFLLTKGDPVVQKRRIRSAGVKRFFERIYIVPTKMPATFTALCKRHQLVPSRAWSIGNYPSARRESFAPFRRPNTDMRERKPNESRRPAVPPPWRPVSIPP